jgi:enediyne biosynthesis protein E4
VKNALVKLETAHGTYTKQYDGKSGYLSQSSLPLYFGLGDDTAVNRVEVRWPSGRNQVIAQDIKVNDTLRIREPR